MANLFTMRGLISHFRSRDLRHGPFIFNLIDLHRGNISVDSEWHIKYIIDVEWACSLPVEMLAPPYWITDRGVDQLTGEHLQTFKSIYEEFMDIFEEEEKSFQPVYGSTIYRTDAIRRAWKSGGFWFFHALQSPKGLCRIFDQHIQPMFEKRQELFPHTFSSYWAPGARGVIAAKLKDKEEYEQQLRQLFRAAHHAVGV